MFSFCLFLLYMFDAYCVYAYVYFYVVNLFTCLRCFAYFLKVNMLSVCFVFPYLFLFYFYFISIFILFLSIFIFIFIFYLWFILNFLLRFMSCLFLLLMLTIIIMLLIVFFYFLCCALFSFPFLVYFIFKCLFQIFSLLLV